MTKEELQALAKRVKAAGLDTNFAARDNTRTGNNITVGYVPSRESGAKPSTDARLDDGILGWVPYVGDALQVGQAFLDLQDRKYKQAALEAGLLFLPNIVEKPVKALVRGANKYLRRIPNGSIRLSDAINRPYKGSNIIKHDADPTYVADVLNGEDRFITPSLGVFRIGDFNNISSRPFKYGEYSFVGDKSLLDKGILFGGDSMSPTVMEVYPKFGSVPSDMREEVAERLWDRTINGSHKATGTRISPSDLSTYPMNSSDGYFEHIYPGLLPMDKFKYVVAPKPGTLDEAYWRLSKDAQEDILSEFEKRGLKVKTYDRNLRPYNFYDDWSEKFLDIANEAGDDILFANGGKLVNYSDLKTLNNHMKVADQIWSLPGYVTEEYGKGGKIHIKPENRGKFTALKKRTGHSASWFKAHGTPAQKKMAVFALNAKKWKHADGGSIFRTKLNDADEEQFQTWYQKYATANGLDPNADAPDHFYDYRGYWDANRDFPAAGIVDGHFPDTWKTPGHPTFSKESIYAKYAPELAGSWDENGNFVEPALAAAVDYSGIKTTNNRRYNRDYISYISDSLKAGGLSDPKRAAILANIIEESGGNPFALDSTKRFYGLLQWADDRYKKTAEKDPYKEIDNQVQYILNTLGNTIDKVSWTHGGSGTGYNSYTDAMADFDSDDLATAMRGLTLGYVRPAGKIESYNNRMKVAQQLYDLKGFRTFDAGGMVRKFGAEKILQALQKIR